MSDNPRPPDPDKLREQFEQEHREYLRKLREREKAPGEVESLILHIILGVAMTASLVMLILWCMP